MFADLTFNGKTVDEIQKYSAVFWAKYEQVKNHQKYLERIERGEEEIAKRQSIDKAIADKFA